MQGEEEGVGRANGIHPHPEGLVKVKSYVKVRDFRCSFRWIKLYSRLASWCLKHTGACRMLSKGRGRSKLRPASLTFLSVRSSTRTVCGRAAAAARWDLSTRRTIWRLFLTRDHRAPCKMHSTQRGYRRRKGVGAYKTALHRQGDGQNFRANDFLTTPVLANGAFAS